ncbi:hypothetical protein ACMFMG_006322 [Clarireedia jacksonii]
MQPINIGKLSLLVPFFLGILANTANGAYTLYTVAPGDTKSSIVASKNVSLAALQLANPQLSDTSYSLVGGVIQIPAICSNPTNVHITVPGDTIEDIAKGYKVDLATLEKNNPQIAEPSRLNPGDCIEVPSAGPGPTTPASKSTIPSSTLESSTSSSSPSLPSGSSCTFKITTTGDNKWTAGQLSDGQIRLNGSYPASTFSIKNGQIMDSNGRGCIVTGPPETQFQCDANSLPVPGFSITSTGSFVYNGSPAFFACPATDTEYNIYIHPDFKQPKCFPITLSASGCSVPSSSTSGPKLVPTTSSSTSIPTPPSTTSLLPPTCVPSTATITVTVTISAPPITTTEPNKLPIPSATVPISPSSRTTTTTISLIIDPSSSTSPSSFSTPKSTATPSFPTPSSTKSSTLITSTISSRSTGTGTPRPWGSSWGWNSTTNGASFITGVTAPSLTTTTTSVGPFLTGVTAPSLTTTHNSHFLTVVTAPSLTSTSGSSFLTGVAAPSLTTTSSGSFLTGVTAPSLTTTSGAPFLTGVTAPSLATTSSGSFLTVVAGGSLRTTSVRI